MLTWLSVRFCWERGPSLAALQAGMKHNNAETPWVRILLMPSNPRRVLGGSCGHHVTSMGGSLSYRLSLGYGLLHPAYCSTISTKRRVLAMVLFQRCHTRPSYLLLNPQHALTGARISWSLADGAASEACPISSEASACLDPHILVGCQGQVGLLVIYKSTRTGSCWQVHDVDYPGAGVYAG